MNILRHCRRSHNNRYNGSQETKQRKGLGEVGVVSQRPGDCGVDFLKVLQFTWHGTFQGQGRAWTGTWTGERGGHVTKSAAGVGQQAGKQKTELGPGNLFH